MPQKIRRFFMCTVLFALGALIPLPAQTEDVARRMADALQLRSAITAAMIADQLSPEAAIQQLRQAATPMGLNIDADAEFAFAAIDIGQRLVARGKAAPAEPFFIEAEKSLGTAIDKTPDDAAKDKAMFLANRAFVRANFLNKTPAADADLARAIALQPEDKRLQWQRDMLPTAKTGRS